MDLRRAARRRGRPTGLRNASIEYTLEGGQLVGTVVLDGDVPRPFAGVEQLEQLLGIGAGRLVLVHGSDPLPAGPESLAGGEGGIEPLSEMERQIVEAAVAGATNREIADDLFYSVKSVEAYLTRIYRRFGLTGRGELGRLVDEGGPAGGEELDADERVDLSPPPADAELVAGGARAAGSPGSSGRPVHLRLVVL